MKHLAIKITIGLLQLQMFKIKLILKVTVILTMGASFS